MPKKNITRGETAQLLLNVFGVIVDSNLDAGGQTYKNVTIRKAGVTLKNANIKGDLFITEGVGHGDIWLDTVQIGGRLLAAGGGENSIHVKDITVGDNVVVDKPSVAGEEPVRFCAIQTNDSTVIFQGTARRVIVTEDVIIIIDNDGEKTVFNMFKPEDGMAKPSVMIANDAVVKKVTAFVPTEIKGGGEVGKVEAHTNGVTIDAGVNVKPENVEAEKGVEVKVGGETVTGTGIENPTTKPSDPVTPPSDLTPTPAPTPDPTPAPTTPPSTGGGGGDNTGGGDGTTTTYYTVTFNSNGGTSVSSITNITYNSKITAPTAPTKTGFAFGGWYKEAALTNLWNFGTDTVTSSITLYAKWTATVLPPATTPTASFEAETMTLSGTTAQMEYSLDGGATWTACTASTINLSGKTFNTTHGIQVRDKGDGTTTGVSAAQTITLTQATTPVGVGATDQTTAGTNDGIITNVSTSMEYRLLPSGSWTACSGATVSNLATGSYEVRTKGTGTVLASAAVTVTNKAGR